MKVVNHQHLIEKLAEKLKGTVTPPVWAEFVKTGHGKQRPPVRQDWWYVRCASILLSVQKLGPVGVSKLSVKYGNRKNKGYKPEKEAKGSTNIIRKALQQLEAGKLIKYQDKNVHKGRVLTTQGLRLINECSKEVIKNPPVKAVKKVVFQEKVQAPRLDNKRPQQPKKEKSAKQDKEEWLRCLDLYTLAKRKDSLKKVGKLGGLHSGQYQRSTAQDEKFIQEDTQVLKETGEERRLRHRWLKNGKTRKNLYNSIKEELC